MDEFRRVWTKKIEKPKSCRKLSWQLFHNCISIYLCKNMPKIGHLWPIWWKDKSTITKQLFCFSSWIIFDFKIEISGKNWAEKHPHIIVFIFGSKTNEFGQVWTEKIGIWRKSSNWQKVLEFFSKTFCPLDLFCQTKFWKKKSEKGW